MSAVAFGNLCAFLMSLAMGVVSVGWPYLVIDWFEAKAWHLGLIAGLSAIAYMVGSMLSGRIARRFRRHHIMAGGALIIACSVALISFAPSIWVVVALIVVSNLGQALYWPALEAYISDGTGPTELRNRIGWFNLSWSTADTMGVFLGGSLFGLAVVLAGRWHNMGFQGAPCLIAGAVSLLIAIIVLHQLRTKPGSQLIQHARDEQVPRSPGRGGLASLGAFWIMALVANGAAMALRATMQSVFPELAKGDLGVSQFGWGVLCATMCLSRTLGFVYWQYRHEWEYRAGYFFWLQMLLPLAAAILIFNSYYWIFLVAFALAGFGSSKTYFASLFYSMDSEHSHQHRSGVHEAVLGAGMSVPLVAGILASGTRSPRAPYVFLLVLLMVTLLVQAVIYRRSRGAQSAGPGAPCTTPVPPVVSGRS